MDVKDTMYLQNRALQQHPVILQVRFGEDRSRYVLIDHWLKEKEEMKQNETHKCDEVIAKY